MNKTAIKNFAIRARKKLIEEVIHKAYEIGVTKEVIFDIETSEGSFKVAGRENGRTFKKYEIKQREQLIKDIEEKGFEQVIEEVTYTWFKCFIALRFMEVNDYLPSGVRVLSSREEGKSEPDIVSEALNIDLEVDQDIVFRLQDENDTEDLYKYLLIKQCNQLGKIMPAVFEEIADYTELLLPDKLLAEGSVIKDLVNSLGEEDFIDQIEIIGWLYQYYILEKKEEVDCKVKAGQKVFKDNIPAKTQLFTPKWIVKYMVENSLGRLWLESYPNEELKEQWRYYLETPYQDVKAKELLDELRINNLNPEEIRFIDPAMGSGHILVYAFDVLYEIYISAGYSEREIPALILEKNVFGLDIDKRACQLASFALMMKARSKNRQVFRNPIQLNLCSIEESNGITPEIIDYFGGNNEELKKDLKYLVKIFANAKEYGSLLRLNAVNFEALEKRLGEIKNDEIQDLFQLQKVSAIKEIIPKLIRQGKLLSRKYDICCTNPPYLGRKAMNNNLANFLDKYYPDSKLDLFSAFIEKGFEFIKENGYNAIITSHSWMFLSSYQKLRKKLIANKHISSLVHIGNNVWGISFGTSAAIWKNSKNDNFKAKYLNIEANNIDLAGEPIDIKKNYTRMNEIQIKEFLKIEGYPFAYWINDNIREIFSIHKKLKDVADPKQGMATTNNDLFLKFWFEVSQNKIGYSMESLEMAAESKKKWFPYNKGGKHRKWYGNNEYVVNFENNGKTICDYIDKYGRVSSNGRVINRQYYFKEGITWSDISGTTFAARKVEKGFIFDIKGSSCFPAKSILNSLLGLLNSKLLPMFIEILNPSVTTQVGDLEKIPILDEIHNNALISQIVADCIRIAKNDWDSFETSWDFKKHPLLAHKEGMVTVADAFNSWSNFSEKQFSRLKENEEELNRIFIDIYGLQDELTPEVEDKDITISKADRERDIKSFISYAVGCMFGRYSLEEEGLIYAGGEFSHKWKSENGEWRIRTDDGWKKSSINIAKDNIIPIADGDCFEDDILERFVDFVKVTFGEQTLEENLKYIADTLGRKSNETSRQAIRRYFLKDFYKDHVKTYKKRPIYWLFESGKQNGFKALIYLHRYDPLTVARVRTDYLHILQKKYETEILHLDIIIDSDMPEREKAQARKRKEVIMKQNQECLTYDQVVAHVANHKLEINLDDGVAINYAKYQCVEVPQGERKKPLKADLLAKI